MEAAVFLGQIPPPKQELALLLEKIMENRKEEIGTTHRPDNCWDTQLEQNILKHQSCCGPQLIVFTLW